MRKAGIVLSLLAVTAAALALIFSSGYQPQQGFFGSLPGMELVLRPGTEVHLADEPVTDRHTFFQWEDAAGKTQTSSQAPPPTTEVRKFQVTGKVNDRWAARPGRTRTELRGRKTLPLRTALAGAVVACMLGLGLALLGKGR